MSTEEIPVELATVQYASHKQIEEVAFRVYGGKSHVQRVEAATQALESYTEYWSQSEGTVVSIDSYQVSGTDYSANGIPYVLFTFGNFTN